MDTFEFSGDFDLKERLLIICSQNFEKLNLLAISEPPD